MTSVRSELRRNREEELYVFKTSLETLTAPSPLLPSILNTEHHQHNDENYSMIPEFSMSKVKRMYIIMIFRIVSVLLASTVTQTERRAGCYSPSAYHGVTGQGLGVPINWVL